MIDSMRPGRNRIVIPKKIVPQVIMMYYDQQGHPGYDCTAATLKNNYYWYGMDLNIETYDVGCNYCQSYKAFNRKAAVPIQAYGASRGFKRIRTTSYQERKSYHISR